MSVVWRVVSCCFSLGLEAVWWSSTVEGGYAWYRALNTGYTSVNRRALGRSYGFSVRCSGI